MVISPSIRFPLKSFGLGWCAIFMIYFREVYPINNWVKNVWLTSKRQNSFLTHSYPSSRLRGFLGNFHSLVSKEVLILDSKPWDIPTFQGTLIFSQKGSSSPLVIWSNTVLRAGFRCDTWYDPFDVSAQFHNLFVTSKLALYPGFVWIPHVATIPATRGPGPSFRLVNSKKSNPEIGDFIATIPNLPDFRVTYHNFYVTKIYPLVN